jgi:hypothetical protein
VNVIDDILYLIGGYSYEKQCSSNVYTLNLETISSNWVDLNPTGDIFDGKFEFENHFSNQRRMICQHMTTLAKPLA